MDLWTTLQFIARALCLSPEAQNVYLFGSTAKQLRSFVGDFLEEFGKTPDPDTFTCTNNDFDLVVTVPQSVYDVWNRELNQWLHTCKADCSTEQDAYHGCKWLRFNLALKLLGCGTYQDITPLFGWLTTLDSAKELDIHLMPENWRHQIVAVQDHLPHKDPNFVGNIARDAIWLTETTTAKIVTWQNAIIKQIAQKKHVVDSIGRAALLSAVISNGITAEATE